MIRRGLAAALVLASVSMAGATDSPVGHWARDDGQVRIRIAPCGERLCAVDTWVRDTDGDERVGDTLVMTLAPKSADELAGHAYDERRKLTYSMRLTIGASSMVTRGCMLFGILCKTAEWTRLPQG